jgi:N-acetylmuramoyl-L-alanine amidase
MRKLVLFLALWWLCAQASWAAYQVAQVRVAEHFDKVRLVFDLKGSGHYRLERLHHPERIVLRFMKTQKGLSFRQKRLGMSLVKRIRTGYGRGGYLVVMDLRQAVHYRLFTLKGKRRGEQRLVLDLFKPTSALARKSKRQTVKSIAHEKRLVETSRTHINKTHQAQQHRRIQKEVLRFTSRPLDDNEIVVAIDAGHGGRDTGAIGPGGVKEKDVTLALARALKRRIDAEPGMRAVLIRDRDVLIPLHKRPKIAKRLNADLFISIHADAFPQDPRVRGGSIYVLNEKGASSALAKTLARSENGSIFLNAKVLASAELAPFSFRT